MHPTNPWRNGPRLALRKKFECFSIYIYVVKVEEVFLIYRFTYIYFMLLPGERPTGNDNKSLVTEQQHYFLCNFSALLQKDWKFLRIREGKGFIVKALVCYS